jgi:hypothetical protein
MLWHYYSDNIISAIEKEKEKKIKMEIQLQQEKAYIEEQLQIAIKKAKQNVISVNT